MATVTEAERQELFAATFPKALKGLVRPDAPIATDFPFSTNIPQFMRTDPVAYYQENIFLRQLLSNDAILDAVIKAIQNQLASCDLRLVTQALKGLMSAPDKIKLDGIQAGATKFTHPATHPATMITPDATHRFTTDAEKNAWNGKANASHGNHVPTVQGANNGIFLRNDNTWQYVTPSNIGAAASLHTHDERYYTEAETNNLLGGKANTSHGTHVPGGGNTGTFLRGDNTWQALSAMGGIAGGSLAQNGWVKFANGLILQWGTASVPSNVGLTVTLPIKFSTECLSAYATAVNGDLMTTNGSYVSSVNGISDTKIRLGIPFSNAGLGVAASVRWLTIGK